ncbi:MAG: thioredoxin domain-containing protein [Candidatus Omnitrophica bacterium]|nr:thioredoxin domain-containing protein [Candidatus Omnitrophota bacterium]
MTTNPEHPNRLIHEKSPYLLQHADNPVDWYPWGPEAFEKAKREDKPIFLSIGYSSCHWCHVMEEESFENEEVAKLINAYFVPIKVDREERPDIDQVYMPAVMAISGQGGWPLTAFLTPDQKPFWGGTYFPPYAKWGAPGLVDVLTSIHEAWQNNPSRLVQSSLTLTAMLQVRTPQKEQQEVAVESILSKGFEQFSAMYDPSFGGFGTAPKFPSSHNLSFLLRYAKRVPDKMALTMATHTLKQMANGGIYDHLGGGFHRYSTDQVWQTPHFEKMLYDQAMLIKTYAEAYQVTHEAGYAKVVRETCDYVLRDMQHPRGGFYSAEDADSLDPGKEKPSAKSGKEHKKREGAFYLWRYEEIVRLLGREDAEILNYYFGVQSNGNVQNDVHGEFTGKNIFYAARTLEETAQHFQKTPEEVEKVLQRGRRKLGEHRRKRPRPFLDDKILTHWNGLMISSLALASQALGEPKYRTAAPKAADFILQHLQDSDGRLRHRYRDGQSAVMGTLDDYAFFIHGLIDLYEATFDAVYLRQARELAEQMIRLFWDHSEGGFYLTAEDAETLLFRSKEVYDGAIPSGNSLAALDLVRFYHITLDESLREKFEKLLEIFSSEISRNPAAHAQMLIALDFMAGNPREIVIAGKQGDPRISALLSGIHGAFIPNKVVIFNPFPEDNTAIREVAPFIENQVSLQGDPTVYVCENHVCQRPVRISQPEQVGEILKRLLL